MDYKKLIEIRDRNDGLIKNDLANHIIPLAFYVKSFKPKIIVELGVRTGKSTMVFSEVAKDLNSKLFSVDINNCKDVCDYEKWTFIQGNDIDVGKEFKEKIDVLFIDSDHSYYHTLKNFNTWVDKLNDKCMVIFHDTNDGSGVSKAISKIFKRKFIWKKDWNMKINEWYLIHHSVWPGMLVMVKE